MSNENESNSGKWFAIGICVLIAYCTTNGKKNPDPCSCQAAWHQHMYENYSSSFYYDCKEYYGGYTKAKNECDNQGGKFKKGNRYK
jgi:hypothetical protein